MRGVWRWIRNVIEDFQIIQLEQSTLQQVVETAREQLKDIEIPETSQTLMETKDSSLSNFAAQLPQKIE